MKKLLALLVAVSFATPAFAIDEKPEKGTQGTKEEIQNRAKGAKGLENGANGETNVSASDAVNNALVNGNARTDFTGDKLTEARENLTKAIASGIVSAKALNEFSKSGLSGVDQEIATAAVKLLGTAAWKGQLSSRSNTVQNSRKESVSLLSYVQTEVVKAINDPNYQGDKQKVLNFLRDWNDSIEAGKGLEGGAKDAVSKLGKSWDDFVKLCLKV